METPLRGTNARSAVKAAGLAMLTLSKGEKNTITDESAWHHFRVPTTGAVFNGPRT